MAVIAQCVYNCVDTEYRSPLCVRFWRVFFFLPEYNESEQSCRLDSHRNLVEAI